MNAHFYNPESGRFLSKDSYPGSATDPVTQNLYTYGNNNPTNMVDPTGHFALPAIAFGEDRRAAVAFAEKGASNVAKRTPKSAVIITNGSSTQLVIIKECARENNQSFADIDTWNQSLVLLPERGR